MIGIISVTILLTSAPAAVSSTFDLEEKVGETVNRYIKDERTILDVSAFGTEAATAAVLIIKSIKNPMKYQERYRLLSFAFELDKFNRPDNELLRHSKNMLLAKELVTLLKSAEHEQISDRISTLLLYEYPPEDLQDYRDTFEYLASEKSNIRCLLLLSILPNSDKRLVRELVDRYDVKRMCDTDKWYHTAISATLSEMGEYDLISRLAELDEVGGSLAWTISHVVSFVPTERIKNYISQGLRSEEKIRYIGGGSSPKREFFAQILTFMFRDDPSFPIKTVIRYCSNDDLDKLERWCAQKLRTKYPDTPRKAWLDIVSSPDINSATR